jgi:hypothetical protein
MKKLIAMLLLSLIIASSDAAAADWITAPSYYTHDPQTGKRVQQYAPIGPFYTYPRGDFTRSGFRHTRSSIQVGSSADHYHTTEQWGKPIRPYGEWRHPYRPYSVPYDSWGPMFPGRGFSPYGSRGGFGFQVPRAGTLPGAGSSLPRNDLQEQLEPAFNRRQQLLDGRYPPLDQLDPFERMQVLDHLYPPQAPPPVSGNPILSP